MSHPSKRRGYDVEIAALNALKPIFPNLRRTGSVAYTKSAADLSQDVHGPWKRLWLVVTRDKRQPLLVTLPIEDFRQIAWAAMGDDPEHYDGVDVKVQVKARARTWIGTLYQELKEATR